MEKIYDNGDLMLGKVKIIKKYNDDLYKKKVIEEDIYNELKEDLKGFNDDDIITIDYSFGMGNLIKKWNKNDVIYEGVDYDE